MPPIALPIKAIIIDDDPFIRDVLRKMLTEHREVEIMGEAGSLDEAAILLHNTQAEVVFLDIQLPGGSGFDLVPHIPPWTHIIFFTAYDQYAIRAFEVNALDYLLKPVRADRLAASIKRLLGTAPAREHPSAFRPDDQVYIKTDKDQRFIPVKYISALAYIGGNYTRLHLHGGPNLTVRRSLREWEKRLPDSLFFRIHRSTIVNLSNIARLAKIKGSHYIFIDGIPDPFEVSRRVAPRIKKIIEQAK